MSRPTRLTLALCLLLTAGCGALSTATPSPSPSMAPGSNVTGTLDRSTQAPCPSGEPCDPPNAAYQVVFSRPGANDVTAPVAPDGSFAVRLAPGEYTVAVRPPPLRALVEPSTIRVPASGSIEVRLLIVRTAT